MPSEQIYQTVFLERLTSATQTLYLHYINIHTKNIKTQLYQTLYIYNTQITYTNHNNILFHQHSPL